jgi:hypothetical protein
MLAPTALDEPMMTDEIKKAAGPTRDSRQDRLKAALRENLRRRRVQARERDSMTDPSDDEGVSPHESAAKPR